VRQAVAGEVPAPPAWQISLEGMVRALTARDITAAEIARRNAYSDAIRNRSWEAPLAAGEGSLRIGDHVVARQLYRARAREAWLSALFYARARRSVHGVLRVTEAFVTRGDTDVAAPTLTIADNLAAFDASGDARRNVLTVRNRLLPGTVQKDSPR
jgi:hypothetical protein